MKPIVEQIKVGDVVRVTASREMHREGGGGMREPGSSLTAEQPIIWARALSLATGLTGYVYAPKMPLPDGMVYACGGRPWVPAEPLDEAESERRKRQISEIDQKIEDALERERRYEEEIGDLRKKKEDVAEEIARLRRERDALRTAPPVVYVPEGSVEALLHEVGHWVASTDAERRQVNYGIGTDLFGHSAQREWQAWAFEEIVLAPWGPARHFATPASRDGNAFMRSGPMPPEHLRHAERQMRAASVDIEAWRSIADAWIRWGGARGAGRAPWEMVS